MQHIGQLQRLHISDATVSANVENLTNTNKSLKSKLAKANDAYAMLKKETATGRTQQKKFESDLSSKVRGLRDAERAWHSEETTLKMELEKARSDCEALRKLVVQAEARELVSSQQVASMEIQLEEVYGHELARRTPSGDAESLQSLTPEALRRFHGQHFRGSNMLVAVVVNNCKTRIQTSDITGWTWRCPSPR